MLSLNVSASDALIYPFVFDRLSSSNLFVILVACWYIKFICVSTDFGLLGTFSPLCDSSCLLSECLVPEIY